MIIWNGKEYRAMNDYFMANVNKLLPRGSKLGENS